jgi:long-chain acyl-CoA synthetase
MDEHDVMSAQPPSPGEAGPAREVPATLVDLLEWHLDDRAEEPAVLWEDETISLAALNEAANRVAHALQSLGVGAGEPVSVFSPNCPELYYAWFGIAKAGAVFNPINALFKAEEAAYVVNHAGSRLLIAHPTLLAAVDEMRPSLGAVEHLIVLGEGPSPTLAELMAAAPSGDPPAERPSPEDLAAIVYTSGTTGRPKGAMLTHGNYAWDTAAACDALPVLPGDRLGLILPLFHVNAQVTTLVQLYVGGSIALFPRFSPTDFWQRVERYQPTTFSAVPTILAMLLSAPGAGSHDTSSLRYVICGAAALSAELAHRFEQTSGLKILEGYGLTEGTCVSSVNSFWLPRKIGSIGLPLRGQRMRVVDCDLRQLPAGEIGEIVLSGANVMQGYYRDPEATARTIVDGWLRTGDAGYMDDEGYFFIVDRIKDMIIRGGENVYPREVEEVLYAHPAVAEAAVVGEPDPLWGETVKAMVTLREGVRAAPNEISAFCRERLADFKVPSGVEILAQPMPKTATGKIDKKALRAGASVSAPGPR